MHQVSRVIYDEYIYILKFPLLPNLATFPTLLLLLLQTSLAISVYTKDRLLHEGGGGEVEDFALCLIGFYVLVTVLRKRGSTGPGSLIFGKTCCPNRKVVVPYEANEQKKKKDCCIGIRGVEGSVGVETTYKLNTGLGICDESPYEMEALTRVIYYDSERKKKNPH